MPRKKPDDEALRRFQEAISGLGTDDLHGLIGEDLRRTPRAEVAIFRIRAELDHSDPPIWRRLDLRSDLTLDVVHQVLQTAFGWTDSHLHRFSLGGGAFDWTSQLFLCPYDVEEGEDDGTPATDVRLDEVVGRSGDAVQYLYDYGDSWEVTVHLEEVLPARPSRHSATVVDAEQAAPPEDSGGGVDLASLTFVVEDPSHVDADELNEELTAPYFVLREHGFDQRLVDLVHRLQLSPIGDDLTRRALSLVDDPVITDPERTAALAAHQWFLDRAKGGGIELTSAGYLKPADVEAASQVVPAVGSWIGKNNREAHTAPLLDFRESLRTMGLLRKYRGSLLLTRIGARAQKHPAALWNHLAERLVDRANEGFEADAVRLLLVYVATSADAALPLDQVAAGLHELGWRHSDQRPIRDHELRWWPQFDTLRNVADSPVDFRDRDQMSPAAAALARDALLR